MTAVDLVQDIKEVTTRERPRACGSCEGEASRERGRSRYDWRRCRKSHPRRRKLEFATRGRKSFLDADVERPLASASAIVDEGNRVVFGSTESHVALGQTVPSCRKNGARVLQLDAPTMPLDRSACKSESGAEGSWVLGGRR